MLYAILERTSHVGYFRPLSREALLVAEVVLAIKQPDYTVRTQKVGTVQTFSWDDAQRIIGYWQKVRPYAEYRLLAYVSSVKQARSDN
jgi:hypothetical protein